MCDDAASAEESEQPPPSQEYRKPPPPLSRAQSIVDELLDEINVGLQQQHHRPTRRFSADSDACTTDCSVFSVTSAAAEVRRYSRQQLVAKDESELRRLAKHLQEVIMKLSSTLVTLLRQRDRQLTRRGHHYDLITAVLQAVSLKRRVDTRLRFSLEPGRGESGFAQWMDATKVVVRLPDAIPADFRKKMWLTLAERYLASRELDWESTARFCFNERCDPDDDNLGVQIVKDLHRTGCSLFSGEQAEQNQALLKRVLLAYARWNKSVGYCQGFNLLAAFVLEVVEWCDQDALKMMIYLVEGVLPEGYFANNLRGLSVDMAVFRELLRLRHSNLATHLDRLQAGESKAGMNYEPPLTNVFTMQWFLTLFTTCLPRSLVVRVWDLILLEGNEVLLRTAITIWEGLADRIMTVSSADEFYSVMGVLTREMVEFGVKDPQEFIAICDVSRVPIPQLSELRDRYTYNIRPLPSTSAPSRHGLWLFLGDDEDNDADSDHQMVVAAAFCGISNAFLVAKNRGQGAVQASLPSPLDPSRMTLDISTLKRQYSRLRQRQRQAHIILTGNLQAPALSRPQRVSPGVPVNNLLAGQRPIVRRTRPPPPTHAVPSGLPVSQPATCGSGSAPTRRVSPRLSVTVMATTSSTSPSTSPVASTVSVSPAAPRPARKASPRVTTRDPIPVETLSWEQAKKLKAGRHDGSSSSSSSSTELCDDNNNRSSSPDEVAPVRKESAEKYGNDAESPAIPPSLPDKKHHRRLKNGTHDYSSDSSQSSSSSSEEDGSRDRRSKRRHEDHDPEKTHPKPPRRLSDGSKPVAGVPTRKSGVRATLVRHREPISLDDDEDGSYKPDDESDASRNSSADSLSSEEEDEGEKTSSKLETVSSLAEVSSALDETSHSLEADQPQKHVLDSLSSETESSRNTFSNMVLSGSDKYNIRTSSEASSWKSSSDAALTTSSSSGPPPPTEVGSRKPSDERTTTQGKLSDEEFQRLSRKFSQSALSDRQAQRMALRNANRRGTDELGTQKLPPNIDRSSSEDADRKLSLGSPPRWTPKRTNTSDDTSGDSPSTELDRFRRDSSKRGSASSEFSVSSRELRKWSYKYDSRNTSNDVSWRSSDTDYQASLRYERSISEEVDDGDAAATEEGHSHRSRLLKDDRTGSFKISQESFDGRLLPYDSASGRESMFLAEKRRGSSLTCNTLTPLNEMTFEKAEEELSQEAGPDIVKYSESSTSSSHLMSPNKELRRSAFLLGQKVSADSGIHTVAENEDRTGADVAGNHDSGRRASGQAPSPEAMPRKSSLKFDASKFFESLAQAAAVTRGARCASEGSATALAAHDNSSGAAARPKTARSQSTDATMTSRESCISGVAGGDGAGSLPLIRRQRCLSGDVGDAGPTPPGSPRRSLGENYNPFPTRRPSFTGCISDFKVKLGLYTSQDKPAVTSASNGCKATSVKR